MVCTLTQLTQGSAMCEEPHVCTTEGCIGCGRGGHAADPSFQFGEHPELWYQGSGAMGTQKPALDWVSHGLPLRRSTLEQGSGARCSPR